MEKRHPLLRHNCENCGGKDDLEYFQFIKNGITLCQDCADLPFSAVEKRNFTVNWVEVNGEFYPPDLPISKRADDN